jgi:hypothetical protein
MIFNELRKVAGGCAGEGVDFQGILISKDFNDMGYGPI